MHAETEQQETQREIKNILGVAALVAGAILITALVFFIFSPLWTLAEGARKGMWPPLRATLRALLVAGTFLTTSWYALKKGRVLLGYEQPKERVARGDTTIRAATAEREGGGTRWGFVFVLALLAGGIGFAAYGWYLKSAGLYELPPPGSPIAISPPVPPPEPEFIATNKYGIPLVKTFTVFKTKEGETNGPITIQAPGLIQWGTFTPNNLLVFLDGRRIATQRVGTNAGPNLEGAFAFTAGRGEVQYWVATGLAHGTNRVSN